MDQRKEILVGLRAFLGNGAAAKIQERIRENYNHVFTISYINMVLNPEDPRYNEIIVKEAIGYGREKKLEQEMLANDVRSVVEPTKTL